MSLRLIFFLALSAGLVGCSSNSDLRPTGLKCEHRIDPVGIDVQNPRLTWFSEGSGRDRSQTAYQIVAASSIELLDNGRSDLWDSGKKRSSNSLLIPYQGKIEPEQKIFWRVRVWDENDAPGPWSDVATWTTGLMDEQNWSAQWIGYDEAQSDTSFGTKPWANRRKMKKPYRPLPPPYFRKEFTVNDSPDGALIHVTALGNFILYINGDRVGEEYFAPGWTDYSKRIYYRTYDVSDLLIKGKNTIAAVLTDGWYAGNTADRGQQFYGKDLRLKAQLSIQSGESRQKVITDGSWKASYGAIRQADMQSGEIYDANLDHPGWMQSGFEDSSWASVVVSDTITALIESHPGEAVKAVEEIHPKDIFQLPSGQYIVDMGQNFSGWARIRIKGNSGDSITMRFAEKLNPDSTIHTRNLRSAHCTDVYVLGENNLEFWEPSFTFRGYQFIEVSGYPTELQGSDVVGVVAHSDLELTGSFHADEPLLNRLDSNIVWSQRSNYFEVPTDCPQRDERLGWLGDAHIFMPTAMYNMDVAGFYSKWMTDVIDGQDSLGRFPSTAPKVYPRIATGWGDGGVLIPWYAFRTYNDTHLLEQCYPAMVAWMDYLEGQLEGGLNKHWSYGDWQNVESETPHEVLSTAYFKYDVDVMDDAALVLGKSSDAERFKLLSDQVKTAFIDSCVDDSGHVRGRTQTGYLVSLYHDLIPEEIRSQTVEHLIQDIHDHDTALTTGIHGTRYLLPVLSKNGHHELAFKLITNTSYPSWGHHINNGATTIWERWDSFDTISGFHEDSTNSLNHFAYGSAGEWLYAYLCGIRGIEPGYSSFEIRPLPIQQLGSASAKYRSPRGMIHSSWRWLEKGIQYDMEVPVNSQAHVVFPYTEHYDVTLDNKPLIKEEGVRSYNVSEDQIRLTLGSGTYSFWIRPPD